MDIVYTVKVYKGCSRELEIVPFRLYALYKQVKMFINY